MRTRVVLIALGAVITGCSGPPKEPTKPSPMAASTASEHAWPELQEARRLAKRDDWAAAAAALSELRMREPGRVDITINHGVALERAGRLDGAMRAYEAALEMAPGDVLATAHLVRARMTAKQVSRAEELLSVGLRNNPDDVRLLLLRALFLREHGETKDAIEAARQVLLRDSNSVAAMKLLGLGYADEGQLELAETLFRNALELRVDDASVYVELGIIEARRGAHQRALELFVRALEIDEHLAVAHANIGAIAFEFRDYERATRAYSSAIQSGLATCTTLSALGFAYEGVQEGANAVKALERAYSLCESDPEILYSIGTICLVQLHDNDCALEHLQRYTKENGALSADHPVFLMIESIEQDDDAPASTPAATSSLLDRTQRATFSERWVSLRHPHRGG